MAIKIILDTNLFIGTGASVYSEPPLIRTLASYSKGLEVELYLPKPCFVEVLQKAREHYRSRRIQLVDSIKAWREIEESSKFPMVEENVYIAAFEQKFKAFLEQEKVEILDFPEAGPEVEELFAQAVKKEFPFDSSGNNFRDAIIAIAAQDVCKLLPKSEVFVVAKDNRFREMLKKSGIKNLKAMTPEEIQAELDSRLENVFSEMVTELKAEIKEFASSHLSEITEFCKTNTYLDLKLGITGEDVLSIKSLNVSSIEEITNVGIQNTEEKHPVQVSAIAVAEVTIEVSTSQSIKDMVRNVWEDMAKRPSKVGHAKELKTRRSAITSSLSNMSSWGSLNEVASIGRGYYDKYAEERTIPVLLEVELEVIYERGEISGLNLIRSKHSDKSAYSYLRELGRKEAQSELEKNSENETEELES